MSVLTRTQLLQLLQNTAVKGSAAGDIMDHDAAFAAVREEWKSERRHLLGLVMQLSTFLPAENSERGPLPGWIVAIKQKVDDTLAGTSHAGQESSATGGTGG